MFSLKILSFQRLHLLPRYKASRLFSDWSGKQTPLPVILCSSPVGGDNAIRNSKKKRKKKWRLVCFEFAVIRNWVGVSRLLDKIQVN